MKSCLQDNDIEIYSKYNEGKSIVAERFIKTLKNKIYKYKYMASISKNVYIGTVNKYSKVKSHTSVDVNQKKRKKKRR